MKWTVVIAACVALVAVQGASIEHDLINDPIVEVHRFFLDILYRIDHPPMFERCIKLGGQLITDKSHYTVYDDYMVRFANLYNAGQLLPQDEFFSAMQQSHLYQLKGLFNFFYYAKDFETLVLNVAWARINVNPGMFVSAVTMTVIHRKDLQGIVLPQIYEILPQLFVSSKYIVAAEKFNWDVWNREIMFEKELKNIYQKHYPTNLYGKQFYQVDFKMWQWWKLMGLDDGWQLEGKSMLQENYQVLRKDPMWASIYSQLKMIWMPIDYSRDVDILNAEAKLAYFTEDVAWNAYWYYLNLDYSLLLDDVEFGLDKDRRGEWWVYNVQQLFARYSMERLSQELDLVDVVPLYGVVHAGYDPQLIAYNGNGFTMRKNNWRVKSSDNPMLFNNILNVENKLQDILSSGRYTMINGTVIDLTTPEAANFVGNLLQGNLDIKDKYLSSWFPMMSAYLGDEDYFGNSAVPNVLLNYETMLRDPLTYNIFQSIIAKYMIYKQHLPPYTHEELLLPGVKIVNVDVSEMKTFYDFTDLDLTTLMNDKMVFHDGKLVWDKALLGRQLRLNHEPFKFNIEVTAEKAQKVVVRVFLGPEFDQYGQKMDLTNNMEYYMELDEFFYNLVEGKNMIVRSSSDFDWTNTDPHTYSELYNYIFMCYEGKHKFKPELFEPHSRFPDRLILPHGWVEGMPMGLFFMVYPYVAPTEQGEKYDHSYLSGIGSGSRHIDNMPFGYPLDRPIPSLKQFVVPNMFYKTVMIYHQDKLAKYYPMLYEHYGAFDESS